MSYAIVNVIGVLFIVFILLWFFVLKSKKAAQATEKGLTVNVNGGVYSPGRIQLKVNQPTTLTFIREDSSSCAATVIFDSMNTSIELVEVNKPYTVVLTPTKTGEFSFHCSMNMYQGKMIVV